jgi:4-carboxymuconolactone decarboxylase
MSPAATVAETPGANNHRSTITTQEFAMVSPALERYTQDIVRGELWKRPDLSPRDRSIVTLAALIARNHTVEMTYYVELALESGVKPREISEIITHLAFYSGWGNAMSAAAVAKEVFAREAEL